VLHFGATFLLLTRKNQQKREKIMRPAKNNNDLKQGNSATGQEEFTIGTLIREARQEKGITQEELAQRVGTTKSYISKIENNIKEVRLSTLQRIVETGLGGQLKLSIKL
jgi:ribosome-binding protein aMBF1 (putative translation factor)